MPETAAITQPKSIPDDITVPASKAEPPKNAPADGEARSNESGSRGRRLRHGPSSTMLVLLGVGLCLFNMATAWYLVLRYSTSVSMGLVTDGKSSATSEALRAIPGSDRDKLTVLDRIVKGEILLIS